MLTVHLEAQASTMIDLAMLIMEKQPDTNGNVIPLNIREGSAQFASAKGNNQPMTLVIAGGTFNVADATCYPSCFTCCGASNFGVTPNPANVPVGGSIQCNVTTVDCNGNPVNPSSWSSSNTAVMTADGSGNVHGVAVGSASIYANYPSVITYTGQYCNPSAPGCPTQSVSPGAGGNVQACTEPQSETTAVAGSIATTLSQFNQVISDTANDNFDGRTTQEYDASPAQDTCWFSGSSVARTTGVTGGEWAVAGGDVPGQHNHWGYDTVGWQSGAVTYYRANAPAHGIAIPCGFTMYQAMQISCPSGGWVTYTPSFGNKLTATIEQTNVINCRYGNNSACQTIQH